MCGYYYPYGDNEMCLFYNIYNDFKYPGSITLRQWAILREYNILPSDKELYNYCYQWPKQRRRVIETLHGEKGRKRLASESTSFSRKVLIFY